MSVYIYKREKIQRSLYLNTTQFPFIRTEGKHMISFNLVEFHSMSDYLRYNTVLNGLFIYSSRTSLIMVSAQWAAKLPDQMIQPTQLGSAVGIAPPRPTLQLPVLRTRELDWIFSCCLSLGDAIRVLPHDIMPTGVVLVHVVRHSGIGSRPPLEQTSSLNCTLQRDVQIETDPVTFVWSLNGQQDSQWEWKTRTHYLWFV